MTDLLKSAREALASQVQPYLDRGLLEDAGIDVDDLLRNATAAIVSTLSHQFILTPRKPLLALMREREVSPPDAEALATRVVMLEMALAASRVR